MREFGPPGGGRASLAPPLRSANANRTRHTNTYMKILCRIFISVKIKTKSYLFSILLWEKVWFRLQLVIRDFY